MSKLPSIVKKITLAAAVLAVTLALIPASSVAAAGPQDPTTPARNLPDDPGRLGRIWAREKAAYHRQDVRLARTDDFIARIQVLIDKADQKGWDTSVIQVALNAFSSVIPAAQAAHNPGAAIIASHSGFDAEGKVTDRTTAIETVKALHQVLKNTYTAMDGTGHALREAFRDFRSAHRPDQAPATP